MHFRSSGLALVGILSLSATLLLAQEPPKPDRDPKKDSKEGEAKKEEPKKEIPPVITEGQVSVGGREIRYRAAAGTLPILKDDGKPSAQVFYIAYTVTNAAAPERPITFCFNGGPGSSSVWLHLGAFGPKRVDLPGDGTQPPRPPGRLVPNEQSLLAVTDLVFIDPVSTGYSRPEQPEKAADFYGQEADVQTVGEFIRLWVTREKRWASPKFLAGESYGVFRAAGLAQHLDSRFELALNGLILVSGVMDFETLRSYGLNDLPYVCYLSAMTATAHYHNKLPEDLQADGARAVTEARSFAETEYAQALSLGASLSAEQRRSVVEKLVRFTGLPSGLIEDHNFRISPAVFRKQLLKSEGKILGRYDARVTSMDANPAAQAPEFDPSDAVVSGAFGACMNAYVREDLKYEKDLPYEVLTRVQPWTFARQAAFPGVGAQLASIMKQNPHLQVLVLCGWRDLATPPDGIRHSLRQLRLPDAIRANLRVEEYDAGHMMYTNPRDRQKMFTDVTSFVEAALR